MKKQSQQYQEMLTEVETIVKEISSDNISLDTLVTKVECGFDLLNKMKERLESSKKKIEILRDKHGYSVES